MPIPTFKFNKLTRTDLLQFDGVNFVNVPVYAVGKNAEWGTEGVGYNSLTIGNITKNIPLVGHKHTTDDILGLQELINDLGANSSTSTDLSKYVLASTFMDHLNNITSAKHVTQAHLDKLNGLNEYWQLDDQGNLYTTYNAYSTQELSAWKNGDYSGFTFSLGTATDIELSGLATDDLLKYNGTKWVNVPMSSLVTGGGGDGSVTSVGLSVPTGLSVTGSPITSSGTLAISFASGYSIPTTTKQTNWDSAYTHSQSTSNPHGVTKAQVGLGNVLNVASYSKTESDAALALKLNKSVFDDLFEKVQVSSGVYAIKAKYDFYSIGGVSAYGLSSGGSGGGGSNVTWGTESGGYVPLIVEGASKSVALSTHTHSQYALTTHNHSGVYEPVFTKNAAFNKSFGTTSGTVAQGNDSRIVNGQTAHGWGNHASAGYALNTALTAHINKADNPHSVTKAQVGLGSVNNTADSAKNVLSATKLTTPRTINGTSFNGSADITTANWGTSRTLSFTGDVTGSSSVNGSANVATAMTLKNSGVTAGTYKSVTVDAKGRVTAGTNPTTLAGYGITDAVTTNTTQTITGTKTFTQKIGANLGVKIGTHATDGLIEWDATNKAFKFNGSLYATGGVSAYGSGSGSMDKLQSFIGYTSAMANYYVPASLGMELYNNKADKSNFKVVTSLPTSPTAGVFYFIKE